MKITYSSNNSGGGWWLKDEDWFELEKAGWNVVWYSKEKPKKDCEYCGGTGRILRDTAYGTKKGSRCFWCFRTSDGERFIGALATEALKDFPSVKEAMEEFERITKQDVSEEGCSCCGPPHSFEWTNEKGNWDYASGEGCLEHLYPNAEIPRTKRELVEKLMKDG